MVKVPSVGADALRAALQSLAFYATTGPRVELGVADGAVRCAGALAAVTFLDQQGRVRAAVHGTGGLLPAGGR